MILVQDMDLVPGFTNRHTAILGPEMFDHAIFADLEIPLRTRIFLGLRNRLPFLFEIPGREHRGFGNIGTKSPVKPSLATIAALCGLFLVNNRIAQWPQFAPRYGFGHRE